MRPELSKIKVYRCGYDVLEWLDGLFRELRPSANLKAFSEETTKVAVGYLLRMNGIVVSVDERAWLGCRTVANPESSG
ncbi:hypothetical protein SMC26_02515 [Actinomadura fulvescens]|uniref:Transposase n=1 Tax=Actinomadura fulvescens TaxID=46160 RepID=A0ABN3PI67_9ACTN